MSPSMNPPSALSPASQEGAAVDLPLPLQAPVPAPAATQRSPQTLWALAGAAVALVVGFAAMARLSDPAPAPNANGAAPSAMVGGAATATPTGAGPADREAPAGESHRSARSTARADTLVAANTANQTPATSARAPVCADCGVVESVQAVKVRGQANGTGAVIGGVLGGVIGHEIGGNGAGTVIGAVGGGIAGHHIEKQARSHTAYRVGVRMDDGSRRSLTLGQSWSVGSRVKVEKNRLQSLPASTAS